MICCLFGKRGSGKTTYLKNYVRSSLNPCIIVDTLDEFEGLAVEKTVDDYPLSFFKERYIINSEVEFDHLIKNIINIGQGRYYMLDLIISEIDFWTSSYFIPETLSRCLRYSRHYHINIYCDVRNPVEINRKITALADKFIIFRITEPRYLDYFKQFSFQLPDKIKKLGKYEYVEYNL